MGNNGYIGKDGTYYNTWREKQQADVKWEQQDKQNRLLEEQNRIMREQQEREQFEARMEARRQAYQQRYEEFEYIWQTEIYPLMIEAKIKDPVKYYENLKELYYNSKPESPFPKIPNVESINEVKYIFTKIVKNNDIHLHLDEYNQMMKDIKKFIAPIKRISTKYIIITFILYIIPFLLSCASGNDFLVILSFSLGMFIIPISVSLYKKDIENNPKLDTKKIISDVNNYIDKKNIENRKELTEWENKIKNYENKRLNNFNYLLEIALEKLSIADSEFEEDEINYKLQFHDYPSNYDKKKNEYLNKKNLDKAKNYGIEDFLDL